MTLLANADSVHMKNLIQVEVLREELLPIRPILKTWTELVLKYSDSFPQDDACYWFNERANISMLAAAAWKTRGDWLALEEFSTYKHGEDSALKNGRCDLWISRTNSETSFAIEAKQVWQGIGDFVGDRYQRVREGMACARKDASKLHKTEAKTRVAGCFVVPSIPASQVNGESFRKRLAKWLKDLQGEVHADAIASVFPESSELLEAGNGRIYPGVCLLLNVRMRAIRVSKKEI